MKFKVFFVLLLTSNCAIDMNNILTKENINNNTNIQNQQSFQNISQNFKNEVQIGQPLNIFKAQDMEDIITDQNIMELAKTYQLQEELIFKEKDLVFDKNHILALEIKGNGNILISFEEPQSDYPLMSAFVHVSSNDKKTIIPFNNDLIRTKSNLMIKLKKNFQSKMPIIAKFVNMTQLEVPYNDTYEVQTIFSTQVNFILSDIKKFLKNDEINRLKFIIGSTLTKQKLKGDEELEFYVNKNKGFPDKQNYDFQSSGALDKGLIKTIPQDSKYFCKTNKCKYYITIYAKNIQKIFFQPRVNHHMLQMPKNDDFHIIEELQQNEVVKYELDLANIQGEWLLQMLPIQNDVQIYVNPDYEPKDLDDYKYKTKSKGSQEIVITENQQKQFEYKNSKFYIAFKPHDDQKQFTTFTFHVYKKQRSDVIRIINGQTESGFLADNEILNFLLDLRSDEPESYAILLTLTSISNKPELILKECEQDQPVCLINDKDIQNSYYQNPQVQYGNKLFRVSRSEQASDKLVENKMMVEVNCFGRGYVYKEEIFGNFHISYDCIFALGIFNNSNSGKPVPFKFENLGLDIVRYIQLNTNTNISVNKEQTRYFKIPLKDETYNMFKFMQIKIVMLTGEANLFFSNYTIKPSETDNEKKLYINNNTNLALETQQYIIDMDLQKSNNDGMSIGIQAKKYSVMNITVSLTNNNQEQQVEVINLNDIAKKQIEREDSIRLSDKEIYYKDFQINIDTFSMNTKYIEISVDGTHVDLQICVQKNLQKVDHYKPCDFESQTGLLKITKDQLDYSRDSIIGFSIRKIVNQNQVFTNFPIKFSTHYSIDQKFQSLILHQPGELYERNIMEDAHIAMQLNVTNMQNFAVIVLTTESPNIHATISYTRSDVQVKSQASLDQHNFAFQINNGFGFKGKYCHSKDCYIYCIVHNQGKKPAKFTLYYLIDNEWISLKNGHEIFVPAKLNTNFYLEVQQNQPVTFFYSSNQTAITAIGNLQSKQAFLQTKNQMKYKLQDEFSSKYKTNVDKYGQIIISQQSVNKVQDPLALFQLIPKYNIDNSHMYKEQFVYDSVNLVRVVAHSGEQKLQPFKEKEDILEEESFYLYKIHQEEFKEFTVFLSLTSGSATMYMSYGDKVVPSLKQFWKKTPSTKGGNIVVQKNDFKGELPKIFTIGVFAKKRSHISLLYKPNFHNLISLKFQKLTELKLDYNQYYYFDLYNKHQQFDSVLYTNDSDLDIAVLEYDKAKYQDFLTVISNEQNYVQKFVYKKDDPPRKNSTEVQLDINSHYVIRVKPIEKDALFDFSIYDKNQPILVFNNKRFHFALQKDEIQIFEVYLHENYLEADVELVLRFGNLEFSVSDNQDDYEKFISLKKPGKKTYKVQVKTQKANDLVVFQRIYIKVQAYEYSYFQILAKPVNEFKEIQFGQAELIYSETNNDIYVYTEVRDTRQINKLKIEIQTNQKFNENLSLLFNSNNDVELNKDSVFLPMPLINQKETINQHGKHILIEPKITEGFFLIKIPKTDKKYALKFQISINNIKAIQLNGLHKGHLTKENDTEYYSMYLPEAGEYRIIPDACAGINLSKPSFQSSQSQNVQQFDQFAQGYPFFVIDEINQDESFGIFEILKLPIRRGLVENQGTLKFQVNKNFSETKQNETNYFINTEFRPYSKQLIMSDYIDLWENENIANNKKITYDYKKDILRLDVSIPKFKDQIFIDYPYIQTVQIKITMYVFNQEYFLDKFLSCGFGSFDNFDGYKMEVKVDVDMKNKNKRDSQAVYIKKDNLKQFVNSKQLQIFVRLNFNFIENQEDYDEITLDQKITDIPYFYLFIKNEYYSFYQANQTTFILLFLLCIIGAIIYFKKKQHNIQNIEIQRSDYQKADRDGHNKIEMA